MKEKLKQYWAKEVKDMERVMKKYGQILFFSGFALGAFAAAVYFWL